MKIRKFKEEDAEQVSKLIKKAQREVLCDYYSKDVIEYFCRKNTPDKIVEKSKEVDFFVAVKDGQVVGINGLKDNEVKKFFVNPDYHKQGVGRKLMENLEKVARERGMEKLWVNSSTYAEGFYERMGFKRKKRKTKKKDGREYDIIVMEKELTKDI